MDTISKTLSTASTSLLNYFITHGKSCFSFAEAERALLNSNEEALKKLLRDTVKRGLLLRLKNGVYWIIPYEENPATYFPNQHLAASCLVGKTDHYIGYYSALTIHSLTTQPSMVEQLVVNKQMKPSTMEEKGFRFQFI